VPEDVLVGELRFEDFRKAVVSHPPLGILVLLVADRDASLANPHHVARPDIVILREKGKCGLRNFAFEVPSFLPLPESVIALDGLCFFLAEGPHPHHYLQIFSLGLHR
jgi:hypothetical protein